MALHAMPRSYSSLTVHIVFSTYERRPFLTREIRDDAHTYIGGIVNNIGAQPLVIRGVSDHVHLLVGMPGTMTVAELVDKVKSNSSKWLGKRFAWQRGYGAFSVSPTAIPAVTSYIRRQEIHHRSVDFREEFVRLLREARVDFDPRYLFL